MQPIHDALHAGVEVLNWWMAGNDPTTQQKEMVSLGSSQAQSTRQGRQYIRRRPWTGTAFKAANVVHRQAAELGDLLTAQSIRSAMRAAAQTNILRLHSLSAHAKELSQS